MSNLYNFLDNLQTEIFEETKQELGEKGFQRWRNTIIPDEKITGGVPFKIIGEVKQKHKDFWTYGKQLYEDLAREYPEKFKKL